MHPDKNSFNIILIIIDALRTDKLGCYGNLEADTPNIDFLAKKGVLFNQAFSCINATDPSLTTISSGKYPLSHGIINHGERIQEEDIQNFYNRGTKLLPEILKTENYSTYAIDWIGRWHTKGYDYYSGAKQNIRARIHGPKLLYLQRLIIRKLPQVLKTSLIYLLKYVIEGSDFEDASVVTNKAINVIKNNPHKRFFLFMHYWDTHTPYHAPPEYIKYSAQNDTSPKFKKMLNKFPDTVWKKHFKLEPCQRENKSLNEIKAIYEGAIAFVDHEIGKLIRWLQRNKIFDNTLVILTGDHGESLTEHEIYFSHHGLYDESLHVPLIFKFPKNICSDNAFYNNKINGLVQHTDILPTILNLLQKKTKEELEGQNLLPLILGINKNLHEEIYFSEHDTQEKYAIRTKNYKYISAISPKKALCRICGKIHGGINELYALNQDPKENRNIVQQNPKITNELRGKLLSWIKRSGRKNNFDEKTIIKQRTADYNQKEEEFVKKKLRDLGYF